MDAKLTSAAVEDKNQLNQEEWREIKAKIKQVSKELPHDDLKLVHNPLLDHAIWQLTVDERSTDHRVYLDIVEEKLVVLGIFDFEFTHNRDQHWQELEERI